jgi:hypothetical protein
MELVEWLRARLDEDEQVAREASPGEWRPDAAPDGRWYIDPGHDTDDVGQAARRADAEHIARHDPARVLREVEAKRRILDLHADTRPYVYRDDGTRACGECGDGTVEMPCLTVRLLALPFADAPGYRDEWRPE